MHTGVLKKIASIADGRTAGWLQEENKWEKWYVSDSCD